MSGRGAGWYYALGGQVTHYATDPGSQWTGPYPTQAAAQAAQGGTSGGGSSAGGWYVITVRKTPQTPFTVQVSQQPFPSGPGVTALQDSGPYATQAQAQAAASTLTHEIVPGIPAAGSTPDWQTLLVRIGEVLLGIVLIGIGLARITGAQNTISAIAKARIP